MKLFFAAFFIVASFILVTFWISAYSDRQAIISYNCKTVGKVSYFFGKYPVFEFALKDGSKQEALVENVFIPSFKRGDRVTLWYCPHEPHQVALARTGWNEGLIFATLFLLVFMTIGVIGFYYVKRTTQYFEWLLTNGRRVEARFTKVRFKLLHLRYTIECEWQDPQTKVVYPFSSWPEKYDPSSYIPKDGILPVYFDPDDPSKYVLEWNMR